MVFFPKLTSAAAAAVLAATSVVAHPGEHHSADLVRREIAARELNAHRARRSLDACAGSVQARELKKRSIARRAEAVQNLRKKRAIEDTIPKLSRRTEEDVETWQNTTHNMTGTYDYNMFTIPETVFDANTSCVLAPEVTDGPYYVVGEKFRSNVKEEQYSDGVDLFLEIQYVDINTCEPIPAIAVDIWNCNATGVYSGISVTGNEAADGYNSTYLRGIQLTDAEGVVSFETIFPGHYDGRATHTHLLAHMNASLASNGTVQVWNSPVTHIGQLFYPEDLRSEVEEVYPYNTNTQSITSNVEDTWEILQASSSYDPFPKYVYLGDSITDGLFAWIQIGVNASADYTDSDYYGIAAYVDSEGGHEASGAGGVGAPGGSGSGMPSGSGAAPSGAMPSETASASA